MLEIEHPVLGIGPAPVSFFRALDVEGLDQARIAEGDHGLAKARRDLANAFDFTLRGEELHARGETSRRDCGRKETE